MERAPRLLHGMLAEGAMPHVDIYIATFSEPPEVVEPTAIAALNIAWPSSRFTVHILDDGRRPAMARLVRRLQFQCRHMKVLQYQGSCRVGAVWRWPPTSPLMRWRLPALRSGSPTLCTSRGTR